MKNESDEQKVRTTVSSSGIVALCDISLHLLSSRYVEHTTPNKEDSPQITNILLSDNESAEMSQYTCTEPVYQYIHYTPTAMSGV